MPNKSVNYALESSGNSSVVEHRLAKARVGSSNLLSRSNDSTRLDGRVVMQRTATPCTPVRFRLQPPFFSCYLRITACSKPCRPDGEIGRHKRLKISRWLHRAGSIPAPGTKYINNLRYSISCWFNAWAHSGRS